MLPQKMVGVAGEIALAWSNPDSPNLSVAQLTELRTKYPQVHIEVPHEYKIELNPTR